MERKHIVKPKTVHNVRAYLDEVYSRIYKGENISLDALARKHHVSGSHGTSLVKCGFIEQDGIVKGFYTINKPFNNEEGTLMVIEETRQRAILHEIEKEKQAFLNRNKALQSNEIKNVHVSPQNPNQVSLYDEISQQHKDRLHIVSAIATGIYSKIGSQVLGMSDSVVQEMNERVSFIAYDLINNINSHFLKFKQDGRKENQGISDLPTENS